jgi:phospholipase/lecithinase/hemolysin
MGQDMSGINHNPGRGGAGGKAGYHADWSAQLTADGSAGLAAATAGIAATPPAPPAPFAGLAPLPPVAAAAASPHPAVAPVSAIQVYPALYSFGGSLSDVGNDFIADGGTSPVAPYYDGRFSNGPLWVEDYAAHVGLPDPMPSLDGGTDFAFAGANTGATDIASTGHDLPQQLAAFEQQVPTPAPGAMYTIGIGSNDVTAILKSGASIPDMEAAVAQSVQAELTFIGDLAARGASNFLLLGTPDLGNTPEQLDVGPQTAADASTLSAYFNAVLTAALVPLAVSDHLNLEIVDTYDLFDNVIADPAAYGFTNVTDPVWTGNSHDPNSGTLAATTQAAQDKYLFFDSLHPTETGAELIADTAEHMVFR